MTYKTRYIFIIFLLGLAVTGLIWRMVDLMVIERNFLLNQGDARSLRVVSIPSYRGIITDRNGEPLAVSVPVDDVWIDPKEFTSNALKLRQLARLIHIAPAQIKKVDASNKKREFAYLKRGITPYTAQKVNALDIPGVFLRNEFRRYYPEGEVTAQLVGLTNIDDQGQEGIELEYNKWLAGKSGKKRVVKDRLGQVVANVDLIKAAVPGHDLALSIDRRIQYLAYSVLKAEVRKHNAKSGSVVVLNAKTGEVLAMVSQPSYNPNNRPKIHDGRFRNRAVTDVTEPGSTIKAFSVANALTSGKYTADTIINTEPGWMQVNGNTVKDDADYGVLTVTGVLQKSSNVGVSKMTLSLPPQMLYQELYKMGFGRRTDSGFPGESPGVLKKRMIWKPFALATLSFGYGIDVTNLQLAQAYSVLADDGIKVPVTLLKENKAPIGQRVMNAKVAHEILVMLESVIEKGGTATRARVAGYRVSGKTGTVRMVGPNGYEANHHTAIFVGVAPVSDPQLVVSVIVKDPEKGGFYGGLVSAPIFSKVMGGALRILDIAPDQQLHKQAKS